MKRELRFLAFLTYGCPLRFDLLRQLSIHFLKSLKTDPVVTRIAATVGSRLLLTDEPLLFFSERAVRAVAVRIELEITFKTAEACEVFGVDIARIDRQPQRARDREKRRRVDSDPTSDDPVGHFVVLRASDPVNEQVRKTEPQEESCHQCPRPDAISLMVEIGEHAMPAIPLAVAVADDADRRDIAGVLPVEESHAAAIESHPQRTPLTITRFPNPQGNFKQLAGSVGLDAEIGHRVR